MNWDKESLLKELVENANALDDLHKELEFLKNTEKYTDEDIARYTNLYEKEFKLSMSNVGIHEDLMKVLENESEFTKRRYTQEADKYLKVKVVEL